METVGLLLKVFWAPGEALFLVSKKPRVLAPLLLLCGVSLLSSLIMFSKVDMTDAIIRQAEARGQQLTEDQRAEMQRMSRMMGPVLVGSATIGTVFVLTLASAIYFGLFTILGREAGFKAFYAIVLFANLPLIVRSTVTALRAWFIPQSALVIEELGSLSVAVFLDPTSVSNSLYALALMIDVVTIWTGVLLVIGFKFLASKNVGLSARIAVVAIVSLAFSILPILPRLLRG